MLKAKKKKHREGESRDAQPFCEWNCVSTFQNAVTGCAKDRQREGEDRKWRVFRARFECGGGNGRIRKKLA